MDLYDFHGYREYLNAWLSTGEPSKTLGALAQRLQMSKPFVSMVRTGRRHIQLEHAGHWAWALRLDPREADYWEALITQEHGPSEKIREDARKEAAATRNWQGAIRDEAVLRLCSDWYIPAIAELAKTAGFQMDPDWIADRLMPPISSEQAEEALRLLKEAGVMNQEGGQVLVRRVSISSGRRFSGAHLNRAVGEMHREFLRYGTQAMSTVPGHERYNGTVVTSLSAQQFQRVQDTLERIVIEAADLTDEPPTRVYQVGVYLLPRSLPTDGPP